MKKPKLREIPLPHSDIVVAIGRVAITWSYVERVVQLCIWELARMESNIGEAVTAQLGLQSRLEILQTLVHERIAETQTGKSLKSLAQSIARDLAPKRNQFIHGTWISTGGGVSPMEPELIVRKARGRIVENRTVTTVEMAIEIAEEVEMCFWKLWDIYDVLLRHRVQGSVIL